LLQEHTVIEGERLDNITAQHLGDPEQFWRVCDANNAIRPTELTDSPGRRIRITLPEGIQGFKMLKGIHLSIMIGPVVALPVPQSVIEALRSVQVTSSDKGASGFQLSFALSKNSPLNRTLLPAGYFDPPNRVIIVATVNGTPNVLMDGVITRQELSPSNEPGQSTLTITAKTSRA